MKVDTKI